MALQTCDECHRKKLRCRRTRGETACRQCLGQRVTCSSHRTRKRMGRPPRTKTFPHGSTGIIQFEEEMSGDDIMSPPKELGHEQNVEVRAALFTSTPSRSPTSTPFASEKHPEVLQVLFDRVRFSSFHHHFMIGPSFSDQFRQAILLTLHGSQGEVLALHQTLLNLLNLKRENKDESMTTGFTEASKSLRCLRMITIGYLNEAAAVLLLGQILFVYHIMVMGTSAHTISQNCLLVAKEWYPALMKQPSLQPITMTPVLIDTVDSLLRRRIPVIKILPQWCGIEDRTIGLSATLLPILYDLCKISNHAKVSEILRECNDGKHPGMKGDTYLEIEQQIRQWEPQCSNILFSKYSHIEISAMMMQARVYRIAGLLIIHRLRYPLGVEDEEGTRLAMTIISELACFVRWAPEECKDMAIYFPLFLAMIEVERPADEILRSLAPYSFYAKCADGLRDFVRLTQAARRAGFEGLWFDMVDEGLYTAIIP